MDAVRAATKLPGELTDKQFDALVFIKDFIEEEGWTPTIEEIAEHLGVSRSTAHSHVHALIRKGWVEQGRRGRMRLVDR